MTAPFSLDRVDPDRWLGLLAAPAPDRARAAVVLAFAHELAAAQDRAREPTLHAIRLQWWRDAVAEIYEDRPVRRHEVALALAQTIKAARLPRAPFEAMIEARAADSEERPFQTQADLHAYLDATAGGVIALCAGALCPGLDLNAHQELFCAAGRAWGRAGLMRALPRWAERRRLWVPADGMAGLEPESVFAGRPTAGLGALLAANAHQVRADQAQARALCAGLPEAAFPALAHATLSASYAKAVCRLADPFRELVVLSPLAVRWRLLAAAALGRV
jgi:phytoene synthase